MASSLSLPLVFESNLGQTDDSVKFLNRNGSTTTYFTPAETVFVRSYGPVREDGDRTPISESIAGVQSDILRMSLVGGNRQAVIEGIGEQASRSNYFIGNSPDEWQTDVPHYQKVHYAQVYPGIDLVYYGTNQLLEHDFIVSPHTDPGQIAFTFDGANDISIDTDGNLVLAQNYGTTVFAKPRTYQESKAHPVDSAYVLTKDNAVTFALGDYDPTKALTIDPPVIEYSTYLGGSVWDTGLGIDVDAGGSAYVTGWTNSANFPTASAYQGTKSSGYDVFVTKLNPNGSSLAYSTFIGGTGNDDYGYGVEVDGSGNAYVTGQTTSSNFPTQSPFQASYGGATDAFVVKLSPSGSSLIFSSYLGGTGSDWGYGLTIDSALNVYLTGQTQSTNFPTQSPFQASLGGGRDNYLTKINAAGSAKVYSTYLGGSGNESGATVKVDSDGNAYVGGGTASTNFPTQSPFQASNGGGTSDMTLTKFNSSGSALVYSTYLGGTGNDAVGVVALDSTGNAYIAGWTNSTNYPTQSPYQGSNAGTYDVALTKFNSSGSALVYSTYIGGSGFDWANGIDVDGAGNAYLTGYVDSTNFPLVDAFKSTGDSSGDAFVTKVNAAGSALIYSSYLGGTGGGEGNGAFGISIDLAGNAYVTGGTYATDFPTQSPYQASFGGGSEDAFVTKVSDSAVTVSARVNPTLNFTLLCSTGSCATNQITLPESGGALSAASVSTNDNVTIDASSNATSGYIISYKSSSTLTSGGNSITQIGGTATASSPGSEQFGINLAANTGFGTAPSGGSGTASAPYATANSFAFQGDNAYHAIATTSGPSLSTVYTVSHIGNITSTTEAGGYSTVIIYSIVATY